MRRSDQITTSPPDLNVDAALSALNDALKRHLGRETVADAVVAAWQDLDFDDRRYLGNAFPRLTTALINLENV